MVTVSLVLVSHSHRLAIGVKEVASQMAEPHVQIEAVGGVIDTDSGEMLLGTDALQIVAAIERCWSPAGVLLLVDLGSAILSAELALEMLPAAIRQGCLISNAPLVEGAIVAALEASFDRSLADVNRVAEDARKIHKILRDPVDAAPGSDS